MRLPTLIALTTVTGLVALAAAAVLATYGPGATETYIAECHKRGGVPKYSQDEGYVVACVIPEENSHE